MTCKLLVVGNAKCGKTSVIRRFVEDTFSRVGKGGRQARYGALLRSAMTMLRCWHDARVGRRRT